jgi:undecaprenyl diphosphate synthase
MDTLEKKIDKSRLPVHIAIIMDGNGRWAKERGFDRVYGHQHGVESVRAVTEAAGALGIKYLTLYAFSKENWNRPQAEVTALMELLVASIENETPTLNKNNVKLLTIGDIHRLPQSVSEKLLRCVEETKNNTGLSLVLALSYSSRWEIIEAAKQIAKDINEGRVSPDEIDEKKFSGYLTTKVIPDPDLLIRTSGEERISNFLLWQLAYTELFFTPTHWPDFGKESLYEAILSYQQRERRFGKTGEQIQTK